MSGYIGTQPVPQATQTRDSFTATSGQTSFSCSGYTPNFLDVFLNGVKLSAADYTASNGSDVVLASGAATGDILEVVAFTTFTPASIPDGTPSIDDNGNATAMTIDSDERVLIGQTTASSNTVGTSLRPDGRNFYCADGNYSAHFNRKSSNGAIAHFAKDDTIVGSIGTVSNTVGIHGAGSGDDAVGLLFVESGTGQRIVPCQENFTSNNGIVNLGWSTNRFKDAYLSGGVYLGGTAAINKLDDVESGTFAPTCAVGYNYVSGRYNKIGDVVTVSLDFQVASNSNGAGFVLTNMPFTAVGDINFAVGYNTTAEPDLHFFWQGTTIYGYDKDANSRSYASYSNDIIRISCTGRVT